MADYEAMILEPDVEANRPDADACAVGTLFPCTDHQMIERNNGATWDDWEPTG